MKRGIIAAAAVVTLTGAAGGSAAILASSASANGVVGAWTQFTLHLAGKKQSGTINASGALLSGSGTFISTQNEGSGEPVLKADIDGCYFRIWVTGARNNNHGTYLITASTDPHNACAGMQGSGDWSINPAGTRVKAQGPLVIYRPSPVETVITPPPTTTPPSTSPPPPS
jgi:hypothetical protein